GIRVEYVNPSYTSQTCPNSLNTYTVWFRRGNGIP
ncbi:zinc ribbon domain-containing protein, partial [Brevibacillus sp. NRS-1366]